jgi:hypothetical protein
MFLPYLTPDRYSGLVRRDRPAQSVFEEGMEITGNASRPSHAFRLVRQRLADLGPNSRLDLRQSFCHG